MAQKTLKVIKRNKVGKSVARKIRKEGNIPSILYGRETEPIPLTVNPNELKEALSTEAGENTLLELHILDNGKEIKKLSLLRDIQFNYITSKPIHFDFQEVILKEKMRIKVPIAFVGTSPGVKDEHGILEEIIREIEIECLPTNIPNVLNVDVSELRLGDSIHIQDLKTSDDFNILHDPDETIVTILTPRIEEVVEEEAAIEAEAEEAEEAPAESESSEQESNED